MRIVIDIPNWLYNAIMDCKEPYYSKSLGDVVRDGTPLPKGCGRLGDLDALEKEIVNGIKAGNYEEGYEAFANINDMDDCVECVKYADTIIEADAPKRRKGTPLEENDSGYNCENWIP